MIHTLMQYSFLYRIQKLGMAAQKVFPLTGTLRSGSGDTLYDIGFLIGLLLWSFGCLWLFFAVAAIIRSKKFPFNLGWWAFTFPLGVFTTCTNQLGREIPSRFFRVLGTVCYFNAECFIFKLLNDPRYYPFVFYYCGFWYRSSL
jgi:tellurite resistance protein TehA-like permease